MYMCVCNQVYCLYTHNITCTCICICICICVYIYIHICICVYIYIYTHICTRPLPASGARALSGARLII